MDLRLRQAFRDYQRDPSQLDSFINRALRAGPEAIVSTVPVIFDSCHTETKKPFPNFFSGENLRQEKHFFLPNVSYFSSHMFLSYPGRMHLNIDSLYIDDDNLRRQLLPLGVIADIETVDISFIYGDQGWEISEINLWSGRYPEPYPEAAETLLRAYISNCFSVAINQYFTLHYPLFVKYAINYCGCVLKYIDDLEDADSPEVLSNLLCEMSYDQHNLGGLYWFEVDPAFADIQAGHYRPHAQFSGRLLRLRAYYLLYQLYLLNNIYAVPGLFPPDFSDELEPE